MSLPRVSSLETFSFVPTDHRSRRNSDVSVRARKLSFNPLPDTWDAPVLEQVQAVGAFEVPKWKRICKFLHEGGCISAFFMLLTGPVKPPQ